MTYHPERIDTLIPTLVTQPLPSAAELWLHNAELGMRECQLYNLFVTRVSDSQAVLDLQFADGRCARSDSADYAEALTAAERLANRLTERQLGGFATLFDAHPGAIRPAVYLNLRGAALAWCEPGAAQLTVLGTGPVVLHQCSTAETARTHADVVRTRGSKVARLAVPVSPLAGALEAVTLFPHNLLGAEDHPHGGRYLHTTGRLWALPEALPARQLIAALPDDLRDACFVSWRKGEAVYRKSAITGLVREGGTLVVHTAHGLELPVLVEDVAAAHGHLQRQLFFRGVVA